MGSNHHYPEEGPSYLATVDGFAMDWAPVTNARFAAFVRATGYRTVAETTPDPRDYPGAAPDALRPGSVVFTPPSHQTDMRFWGDWWSFVPGACWRHPRGDATGCKMDHPVVHVAYDDAGAYALWAGQQLPTEVEWEWAAGGAAGGTEFAWGDELTPGGIHMANIWQGRFPIENLLEDGHAGTSPVGAYPPNHRGLVDMIGNVWEWTADWWSARPKEYAAKPCCTPENLREDAAARSLDPRQPGTRIPRKVIKGGSHLCAPNYCRRYRPSARQPQAIDTGTSHIGFRCVSRDR